MALRLYCDMVSRQSDNHSNWRWIGRAYTAALVFVPNELLHGRVVVGRTAKLLNVWYVSNHNGCAQLYPPWEGGTPRSGPLQRCLAYA